MKNKDKKRLTRSEKIELAKAVKSGKDAKAVEAVIRGRRRGA